MVTAIVILPINIELAVGESVGEYVVAQFCRKAQKDRCLDCGGGHGGWREKVAGRRSKLEVLCERPTRDNLAALCFDAFPCSRVSHHSRMAGVPSTVLPIQSSQGCAGPTPAASVRVGKSWRLWGWWITHANCGLDLVRYSEMS